VCQDYMPSDEFIDPRTGTLEPALRGRSRDLPGKVLVAQAARFRAPVRGSAGSHPTSGRFGCDPFYGIYRRYKRLKSH